MNFVVQVADRYHHLILQIADFTGQPENLLHMHAGMAILCLTRLLTGRSIGTGIPLLCVTIAELANEALDRVHAGAWNWPDTSADVFNTLLWPLAITLAVHFRPLVGGGARRGKSRG